MNRQSRFCNRLSHWHVHPHVRRHLWLRTGASTYSALFLPFFRLTFCLPHFISHMWLIAYAGANGDGQVLKHCIDSSPRDLCPWNPSTAPSWARYVLNPLDPNNRGSCWDQKAAWTLAAGAWRTVIFAHKAGLKGGIWDVGYGTKRRDIGSKGGI
jgi:hypothetical protein